MRKALFLVLMTVLSGCATIDVVREAEKDFQAAAALVKENKFPAAVTSYTRIVTDSPHSALAADALFEIALIQANPDNPGQDYARAIQSFERLIKRYSDHKRSTEARAWISALKTVQELKKQIEQLKRIDIRHEEKRRRN